MGALELISLVMAGSRISGLPAGSSGRFDLAGRKEIGNDTGTVRVVGVNSVDVNCEGIVVGRAF